MDDGIEQLLTGQYYKKLQDMVYSQVTKRYHLSLLDIRILLFFHTHANLDTARDLVQVFHLTKSNVSKSIDGLLERGYLQKEYDKDDKRYIHLIVQPAAGPVLEMAARSKQDMLRKLFRGVTEEEMCVIGNVAQKIHQNISDALYEGNE